MDCQDPGGADSTNVKGAPSICSYESRLSGLCLLRTALCLSNPDMRRTPFAFGSEDGVLRHTLVCQDEQRKFKSRMGCGGDGVFGDFQIAQRQAWGHSGQYGLIATVSVLPDTPFSFFWQGD